MASKGVEVGSVLVLMAVMLALAMAQSGCTNVLIGMAPCLNFVTGSSTSPSSSCCSSLASVVKSQPRCLCNVLSGQAAAALGININRTQALALPGACNVQTPPVSRCDVANGPGTSPFGSPESSPEASPESVPSETPNGSSGSPTSSSVSGSKTTPANGATSGGSVLKTPSLMTVASLVLIASYASTFNGF